MVSVSVTEPITTPSSYIQSIYKARGTRVRRVHKLYKNNQQNDRKTVVFYCVIRLVKHSPRFTRA